VRVGLGLGFALGGAPGQIRTADLLVRTQLAVANSLITHQIFLQKNFDLGTKNTPVGGQMGGLSS
jgi:hypothetical protein